MNVEAVHAEENRADNGGKQQGANDHVLVYQAGDQAEQGNAQHHSRGHVVVCGIDLLNDSKNLVSGRQSGKHTKHDGERRQPVVYERQLHRSLTAKGEKGGDAHQVYRRHNQYTDGNDMGKLLFGHTLNHNFIVLAAQILFCHNHLNCIRQAGG